MPGSVWQLHPRFRVFLVDTTVEHGDLGVNQAWGVPAALLGCSIGSRPIAFTKSVQQARKRSLARLDLLNREKLVRLVRLLD